MSDGRSAATLGRAERIGRTLETSLLVLVLSAMIVLAATQIVLRNLSFAGFGWADEALRIMVLWVTILGAIAASRDQRHVSIDALSRYIPRHLHRWIARLIDAFAATVCITLAWYSCLFVADSWSAGDRVLGDLPAWAVQLILPVGFALMGYRYAISLLRRRPHRADQALVP